MKKRLKELKEKLQFTGWLQYLPTVIAGVVLFLLAQLFSALDLRVLYFVFIVPCLFLLFAAVFDLVTVKFNLRPDEELPERMGDRDAFDLMRARKSCRSFQDRLLTAHDREEILREIERANNSPERNIGDNPIRFVYVNAPLTVWPVVGVREFIIAVAPEKYNRQSVIDVGRNLQKIVHYVTGMGLGTCWIGPGADQSSVTGYPGNSFDPGEDHIICVCAVGYKSKFSPLLLRLMQVILHRRLPLSSLFFTDRQFREPANTDRPPFNRFGRCYEVCRWAPSSYNAQTTRCVAVTDSDGKAVRRFDFYTTTQSRYYAPAGLGIWCANWEIGCEALGIKGEFKILSPEERGVTEDSPREEDLPEYGVSWVVEEKEK